MDKEPFAGLAFHGRFRKYQERVLANSEKYLSDGKINIVASPGSGKTILGLELIRRLEKKCIILTPTTTIKYQWGQRFKECFLDSTKKVEDYLSYDLRNPRCLNVITYQTLYSMMRKIQTKEKEDDFSDVDIFDLLEKEGIGTICLDEAHHLKNQWQKALSEFLEKIGKKMTILSLTATPPYDSEPSEWKRYLSTCGEIDEEIFVPELVKEKTLCPHQDFIYFNYPTKEEEKAFSDYRREALLAIEEINELPFIGSLSERIDHIRRKTPSRIYSRDDSYFLLEKYLKTFRKEYNPHLYRTLSGNEEDLSLPGIETVYTFLLKEEELLTEEEKKTLKAILDKHGLTSRQGLSLYLGEKLKRQLISSKGKLQSIVDIARSEKENLQGKLRMLILTDFIRKAELSKIGTEEDFHSLSILSIFETLRREGIEKLGVLSGSLILLPEKLKNVLTQSGIPYQAKELGKTGYCLFTFEGNNQNKVRIVSALFERGDIEILIGTQSLLGEGYDSPCINSLILASYVGSFVLSNQMRGRAIRVDKKDPEKTSNIFHLVTVEPDYLFKKNRLDALQSFLQPDKEEFISEDFDMLRRRFRCFIGPNYDTGRLEAGIKRITYVKGPFNKKKFQEIDRKMLELSRKRKELHDIWDNALVDYDGKTYFKTAFDKRAKIPTFTFTNFLSLFSLYFFGIGVNIFISTFARTFFSNMPMTLLWVIIAIFTLVLIALGTRSLYYLILHHDPNKSFRLIAKAIHSALVERNKLSSDTEIVVDKNVEGRSFSVKLENASFHEQNLFMEALNTLFAPIDKPMYLLVRRGPLNNRDYHYVFALPEIFQDKPEDRKALLEHLDKILPSFELVYVRHEEGYKVLLKARKKSFVNKNGSWIESFIDFK